MNTRWVKYNNSSTLRQSYVLANPWQDIIFTMPKSHVSYVFSVREPPYGDVNVNVKMHVCMHTCKDTQKGSREPRLRVPILYALQHLPEAENPSTRHPTLGIITVLSDEVRKMNSRRRLIVKE